MTFFQDLYKKLFTGTSQVVVHEVLNRSSAFLMNYSEWKNSESSRETIQEISRSWHFKKNNIKSAIKIELFESSYSNGLTILSNSETEKIPLAYVMEYIKDILLSCNYRLVHNDRKIHEEATYVLKLERYLLKPNPIKGILSDQLYGNILIELKYRDHKEEWLKLMANIYSGRKYKEPMDFNELISLLFD